MTTPDLNIYNRGLLADSEFWWDHSDCVELVCVPQTTEADGATGSSGGGGRSVDAGSTADSDAGSDKGEHALPPRLSVQHVAAGVAAEYATRILTKTVMVTNYTGRWLQAMNELVVHRCVLTRKRSEAIGISPMLQATVTAAPETTTIEMLFEYAGESLDEHYPRAAPLPPGVQLDSLAPTDTWKAFDMGTRLAGMRQDAPQILGILKRMHSEGLAHLDLKPSNFCRRDDEPCNQTEGDVVSVVRAIDCGTLHVSGRAKLPRVTPGLEAHVQALVDGPALGLTWAYLSPERWCIQRQCGWPTQDLGELSHPLEHYSTAPQADVWAAGVTLYECLTGHLPFGGDDGLGVNSDSCFNAVLFDFSPPFHDFWDYDLCNLLQGMLLKNPDQRLTAAECLAHPWVRDAMRRVHDSAYATQAEEKDAAWLASAMEEALQESHVVEAGGESESVEGEEEVLEEEMEVEEMEAGADQVEAFLVAGLERAGSPAAGSAAVDMCDGARLSASSCLSASLGSGVVGDSSGISSSCTCISNGCSNQQCGFLCVEIAGQLADAAGDCRSSVSGDPASTGGLAAAAGGVELALGCTETGPLGSNNTSCNAAHTSSGQQVGNKKKPKAVMRAAGAAIAKALRKALAQPKVGHKGSDEGAAMPPMGGQSPMLLSKLLPKRGAVCSGKRACSRQSSSNGSDEANTGTSQVRGRFSRRVGCLFSAVAASAAALAIARKSKFQQGLQQSSKGSNGGAAAEDGGIDAAAVAGQRAAIGETGTVATTTCVQECDSRPRLRMACRGFFKAAKAAAVKGLEAMGSALVSCTRPEADGPGSGCIVSPSAAAAAWSAAALY